MILVTRFSALGDIAMTIPALYDACTSNPDVQFLMLTRKGPAKMFVNSPKNLRVLGINLDDYKGAAGLWRLANELVKAGVSKMVDLHDVLRTQLLRAFLASKGIPSVRLHKGRVAKRNLTRASNKHIVPLKNSVERYRDAFRRAGLNMTPSFRSVFPSPPNPDLFAAATPPKLPGEKWIGVAPFAKHKGKIYPPELMQQALAIMAEKENVKIFIFAGGPDEEARARIWADMFPSVTSLANLNMGFEAELALMSFCDVVLSMDSANMHLASLAGTRVVSVWGATHPFCGFMGFGQSEQDAIQLQMSCRPCSVFGNKPCRRGDYHCLRGISPLRIVKSIGLAFVSLFFPALAAFSASPLIFSPSFPEHPDMPQGVLCAEPQPFDAEYDAFLASQGATLLREGCFQRAFDIFSQVRYSRLPLSARVPFFYDYASATARLGLLDKTSEIASLVAHEEGGQQVADFLNGYLAYRSDNLKRAKTLLNKAPRRFFPNAYLAQIAFREGKWAEAASLAESAISQLDDDKQTVNEVLRPDLLRVAALAFFKQGNDNKALSLLTDYLALVPTAPADDALYAMGQLQFEAGNPEMAAQLLNNLLLLDSQYAQGASYTLAQIEAAQGHDREAALAFNRAARLNFDPAVGQNAIYNYIAAGSNGASVPFASAAQLYEQYLAAGHATGHDDSLALRFAREYYREGNFSKALQCVERIAVPDEAALSESLKILYQLGRQEVALRKYAEAESHLLSALSLPGKHDAQLLAECRLWLGEALYAQGKFAKAADAFSRAAKSLKGSNRSLALYNYAYSLFQQDKFSDAAKAFSNALAATPALSESQRADAAIRLADCRFYTGRYADALQGYKQALSSPVGADYANMRYAVALGLTGSVNQKIKELSDFPASYPNSRWIPDVLLELGNTYAALDRQDEAAAAFARIAKSHPASPQARKGQLAMAQALAKKGDSLAASQAYKYVISSWPSSEEAAVANEDMMRLAAADGSIRDYAAFLNSVPGAPKIDSERLEVLAFDAAEDAWADDINDIRRLKEYLADWPDGRFVPQALLDIAESYSQADNRTEALNAYLQLELKGGPDYAPEAYAGVMRNTDNKAQRTAYAEKVIQTGGLDPESMQQARLFFAVGNLDSAAARTASVATLSDLAAHPELLSGARAAVELGEWQLNNGKINDALKTLSNFTDAGSPHSYWLARGFIALSDVYRKKGDAALADEYLRSLRANYPGKEPDILNAISSRLK